jgi:hypothetical protein
MPDVSGAFVLLLQANNITAKEKRRKPFFIVIETIERL